MTDAIVAEGLVKRYGSVVALDGLDLRPCPRAPSWACSVPTAPARRRRCGCSPRCSRPTRDRRASPGSTCASRPSELRTKIGLSGQYAAVDDNLTGFENLDMVGRLYHLGRARSRERARELLARFDLEDAADRPVKGYSGGMRRRLDLAGALVAKPSVLFLDEPTTGLDPRIRLGMWDGDRGTGQGAARTLLLTTQYLEEADRLADQIAVIDHGQVIAEGTADQLKDQVGGERLELSVATSAELDTAETHAGRPRRRPDRGRRPPAPPHRAGRGRVLRADGGDPAAGRRVGEGARHRAAQADARRRVPRADRPRRGRPLQGGTRSEAAASARGRRGRRQAQPDQDQTRAGPAGVLHRVADHVRAAVRLRVRRLDRDPRHGLPRVPDGGHLRADGAVRRHHHRQRSRRGHDQGHHRQVPLAADGALGRAGRPHHRPTWSTTRWSSSS